MHLCGGIKERRRNKMNKHYDIYKYIPYIPKNCIHKSKYYDNKKII